MSPPKILILTLYSGEHEYDACVAALHSQKFRRWEHRTISHLPNKEAHDTLYGEIMRQSQAFDLFVKLDADMVLSRPSCLDEIVSFFDTRPMIHQANFAVEDSPSRSLIMGLIVFRNTAHWSENSEPLFVDGTPKTDGKRVLVWGHPSPLASHCSNPHSFQAFHFGVHRALKATQRDYYPKRWIQSAVQWQLLLRIWLKYKRTKDPVRRWIILGANAVCSGQLSLAASEYGSSKAQALFNVYSVAADAELSEAIESWARVVLLQNMIHGILWFQLFSYKVWCRLRLSLLTIKPIATRAVQGSS